MAELKEKAQRILDEKEAKIKPENLVVGTSFFDVEGTATSDANATSGDLIADKTAYVNGTKVTGTRTKLNSYSDDDAAITNLTSSVKLSSITSDEIALDANKEIGLSVSNNKLASRIGVTSDRIKKGVTILGIEGTVDPDKPDQSKICTPTTSQQIITADEGYELASVTVNAVTSAIDNNIVAENIKEDVTILGVTGTFKGGEDLESELSAQEQLIQELKTALAGKTAYKEGAKIFETVEQMQEDKNPEEGDLAVVYREEIQPVTEESEFDSCIFPNTVVLDEAFSDSIYGSFRSTGSTYFNGMVDISSSRFRFNGWGDGSQVRVQYTSNDGITYTRTDGGEELQEFGTVIKYEPMEPWNDVISEFMKIGGNYFDGLYRYTLNTPDYTKTPLYKNGTASYNNSTITYNLNTTYVDNFTELFETIASILPSTSGILVLEDYNGTTITKARFYEGKDKIYLDSSNVARVLGTEAPKSYTQTEETFNKIHYFDLSNNTHSVESVTVPVIDIDGGGKATFLRTIESDKYYIMYSATGINYLDKIIVMTFNNNNYFASVNVSPVPHTINKYINAPTQLDTTEDYVYEKTFYGKNGVENGNLTNDISSDFIDINANLYTTIQLYYDTLPVRVLSDNDKSINNNIYTIPIKKDGTPLIDFGNITNMTDLFMSKPNLKSIPAIDTHSATNMGGLFRYSSKLESVELFDTSNVTDMSLMFMQCSSLKSVPLFDTKNVTTVSCMFTGCSSLVELPQFDTRNVQNMSQFFDSCSSLTTIPLFDTSSVTSMSYMCLNSTSLSNESLNNILAMCVNAVNYTADKTLKALSLTQEQANICTTLSNYNAFTTAGWTTGY